MSGRDFSQHKQSALIAAEQALIGAALTTHEALSAIQSRLHHDSDWLVPAHHKIIQAIADEFEASNIADPVLVARRAELNGVDGSTQLVARCLEVAAGQESLPRYIEVVLSAAIARAKRQLGKQIIATPALAGALAEGIAYFDSRLEVPNQNSTGIGRWLDAAISEVQEAVDGKLAGVPTGYVDLDDKTSGFQPGDLIVIAGRPSIGKTAFALNVVEHVGLIAGLPVAVFSMEMSGTQLAKRLISSAGRLSSEALRSGRMDEDAWSRFSVGIGRLNQSKIEIDETGGLTPSALKAKARTMAKKHGKLGMVVVDYLQLMVPDGRNENRNADLSEISRSLKNLAKELLCPVVALSQLSRKVEERTDKRPMMSDLRESGAIEQDADVILMLYRDEYYKPDSPDKGIAEVIISKQRNGPTGTVRLAFLGEYTRFENLAGTAFGNNQGESNGRARPF